MGDTRLHLTNLPLQKSGVVLPERVTATVHPPSATLDKSKASNSEIPDLKGKCLAVSPEGLQLNIPKELFTSLMDFMQTRKGPGSITIQFRTGEIVCVEAVSKKTYRNS